jgi:succinoglycan biosynthesis transport protein ExoP
MSENTASQNQSQIRAAKTLVRRYRRMTCITTVLTMTAIILYSLLMKPVYKTTASVLIENKSNTILSNVEQNIDYSRDLALAQKALALSTPVLERAAAIARISEWNLPDFDIEPLSPFNEHVASAKIEGQLLILEILNTDPDRAVTLANAWMTAFVEEMAHRQSSASAYASGFLDVQLPAMKNEWTARQTALQNFLIETNFDRKEAEYHPVYKQYIDLNSKITQGRIELAALKSEAAAWESGKSHPEVLLQLPRSRTNSNILAYEKLIQDKNRETIELRQNFDAHGEKVQRAEAALAEMEELNRKELQSVGEQLRLEIQIQEKSLADMETLFQQFKDEYLKLKSNEGRYQTLAFEAQLAQNQYEELMKRQRDASVEGTASNSYAQPWEHAEFPLKKYRPNWLLNIAIGIFLSGFLSVSIAGVRELLNEHIRTAAELRQIGHPAAVEIPYVKSCPHREILSLVSARPQVPASHALRMLRSSLAATHLWSSPRKSFVIMVTSAGHGEGKTFIAANLALIFAKTAAANSGRVLLIDTDLNQPTLTYELNRAGQQGVGGLQEQPLALEELVRTTGTHSLDFVPAGPSVRNSGALIESPAFAQFLQEARKQYSAIIIDAPPTLCGSILLEKSDAVLAVVRSRQTRWAELERFSGAISKYKNVSYILNAVNATELETMPAPSIPKVKVADCTNDSLYEAMTLAHE